MVRLTSAPNKTAVSAIRLDTGDGQAGAKAEAERDESDDVLSSRAPIAPGHIELRPKGFQEDLIQHPILFRNRKIDS